jgi:uncharacterized RDD family membrane protein YckC
MIAILTLIYLYVRSPLYEYATQADIAGLVGIGLFACYEPLLTSFFCTIGQAIMGFRVRKVAGGRISVVQAYVRVIVKYLLGMLSFLTMPARADRRAIHDLAAGTIVVGTLAQ